MNLDNDPRSSSVIVSEFSNRKPITDRCLPPEVRCNKKYLFNYE